MYIQVYTGHNRYVPTSVIPVIPLHNANGNFYVHCVCASLLYCSAFIYVHTLHFHFFASTSKPLYHEHCHRHFLLFIDELFCFLLLSRQSVKQTNKRYQCFFFCFSFRFCFCFNRNIYPCMCNMHITVNIYHRVTTSYQKPTKKKKEESEKAGNLHTRDYL